MSLYDLDIQKLKGVGEKRAALFAKLGAPTVGDLLRLYPRDYQDWTDCRPIGDAPIDEVSVVRGQVLHKPTEVRIRGGKLMYRCTVTDGEADLKLTFFNNRYIPRMLEEGRTYLFRGKMGYLGGYAMTSPEFVPESRAQAITPIYPATQGLASRAISAAVKNALALLPDPLPDPLPQGLREENRLCNLRFALENIHFPRSMEDLEAARRRLVFEEFLVLQLGLVQLKTGSQEQNLHPIPNRYPEAFADLLPFRLTGAQQRAISQSVADMAGPSPMNRLIQGDVGSGKTAVAAALCWSVVKAGWQAALMAPTEILAAQHFQSLSGLLEPAGIRCGLLTGGVSPAEHKRVLAQLAAGELDLVIGTHALISEKVAFHGLGLVITDEQHRFGVKQRVALAQKGASPHMLVMSATPIPRTLALMAYGDLDVSVLDELPPGRQEIATYLISPDKRQRAFGYVQKHLDEGRQGYLICPLIEEEGGSLPGLMDLDSYLALVREAFPKASVAALHGKMKPAQKERVMADFAAGKVQLLVATTVVEVGMDVPNAAIMLIENAERYGLSQLHQLRGRIGRGPYPSTCILISGSKNADSLARLRIFKSTNDGFAIADADLKQRGPGDFFGQRQHGLPQLKIASMSMDLELLRQAQKCARRLFRTGAIEGCEYRLLRGEVSRLSREFRASLS